MQHTLRARVPSSFLLSCFPFFFFSSCSFSILLYFISSTKASYVFIPPTVPANDSEFSPCHLLLVCTVVPSSFVLIPLRFTLTHFFTVRYKLCCIECVSTEEGYRQVVKLVE